MRPRDANENSNERMADRPPRDEDQLDELSLPVDDTASDPSELPAIDDV